MGGYSSFGIEHTFDRAARFVGRGFPCYLRTYAQPQTVNEEFASFGFQVSASGSNASIDTKIDPPIMITDIALRDSGLNAAQLPIGSKKFQVSQHWVKKIQEQKGYYLADGTPDYYSVFRSPTVIGLMYENRLYKIISILPDVIGRNPTWWFILGAFAEQPPTV